MRWLVACVALPWLGCGGEAALSGGGGLGAAGDGGSAGAGGGGGQGGGASVPCCACGDVGLGTQEDLAATPRDDVEAEMLALAVSSGLTARQQAYERAIVDLAKIRVEAPEISDVRYRPAHDGKMVLLSANELTIAAIRDGSYDAWQCLNEHYGLVAIEVLEFYPGVFVELEGIYETSLIAPEYEGLPGIVSATFNSYAHAMPGICLIAFDEDFWHLVGWTGSGDCEAGCIYREYWYFTTTAAGDVELVGTWQSDASAEMPSWVKSCP